MIRPDEVWRNQDGSIMYEDCEFRAFYVNATKWMAWTLIISRILSMGTDAIADIVFPQK
jgi:hypothetical protein